jgi:hypothetical protein
MRGSEMLKEDNWVLLALTTGIFQHNKQKKIRNLNLQLNLRKLKKIHRENCISVCFQYPLTTCWKDTNNLRVFLGTKTLFQIMQKQDTNLNLGLMHPVALVFQRKS